MIHICWRAPQPSSFGLITWKRNARICVLFLAVVLLPVFGLITFLFVARP